MQQSGTIITRCLLGIVCLIGLLLAWGRLYHERLLTVQSGSMAPTLQKGDALVVLEGKQPIQPGDVVSYRSGANHATLISHRLQRIDRGRYIFQGDALSAADPPVERSQLVGRAVAVLPHFGRLLTFSRRPAGLTVFVYMPASLLIAGEVHQLFRGLEQTNTYRLRGYQAKNRQIVLD